MATKLARNLVSKQKRRYTQDGFDLDLSYITECIIAMGIPSEGTEGLFRNNMDDVIKFFEHYHPNQAKIFNLCIEDKRQYEVDNFSGQVASFPFYDHNCPPLELIPAFCASAYTWLKEGPEHVIAVHCKAGKSRTGVMVCCLLLHMKEKRELDDTITFYGFQRCYDGQGVTIPSQRRYINYYRTMIRANDAMPQPARIPALPQSRRMRVTGIQLFDVPRKVAKEEGHSTLHFALMDHASLSGAPNVYESWSEVGGIGGGHSSETLMEQTGATDTADARFSRAVNSLSYALDVAVGGDKAGNDFKLMMYTSDEKGKRHKLFWAWMNTCFMPEPEEPGAPVKLVMYRDQCDKFKGKKKYAKTFRVEITFVDVDDRAPQTDPEKVLRQEKLTHYDPWVVEDVAAAQQAAIAGKKKKSKGGEVAPPVDEAAAEAATKLQTTLRSKRSNKRYVQAVQSTCVHFVESAILGVGLPACIEARKDWGGYKIEGLSLTDVSMDADHLRVDLTDGVNVSLGAIQGQFRGFNWIFDRTKMPKASDSCDADATIVLRVDISVPVEADESSGQLTAGLARVKVSVDHLDLEILNGKHPWIYKRMSSVFIANIRESVQAAWQDCAEVTKASRELAARIADATAACNRAIEAAVSET